MNSPLTLEMKLLSLHGEHGEGRAFTWDFEGKV
jgi:hypothetical protein